MHMCASAWPPLRLRSHALVPLLEPGFPLGFPPQRLCIVAASMYYDVAVRGSARYVQTSERVKPQRVQRRNV